MRRKKRNNFLIWVSVFIAVCGCFAFSGSEASAASASISITSRTGKYYVGDTVYVVITVKSGTPIKSFQGTFSYDNSVLRYMTGGSIASGNDSEFYISDTERETAVTSMKYSIKFYVRKAKGTTIALKQPYIVAGEDGSEMSVSFNSLNLMIEDEREENVTPAPKESKKPKKGNTAKPKKTPSTPPKPSKSAIPNKSHTNVPSASPKKKSDGKQPDDKSGNTTALQGKSGIMASRSGESVTLFAGANYIVEELGDASELPEGFGETQCEIGGELVTAYALESETEHSYFLIYCKKKKTDDKAGFYLYDKEEQTVMPYDKVQSWYRGIGEKSVVGERRDVDSKTEETLKYIIAVMVVFCVLMLIAVISVYLHFKGEKDDYI